MWTMLTNSGLQRRASCEYLLILKVKRVGSDLQGTRVSSLAEKPFFNPKSQSKAEALNLPGWLDTAWFDSY